MLRCFYVDGERNFEKLLGHNKRHKYGLISKFLRIWRNKEALKMECNKHNRNIRYNE